MGTTYSRRHVVISSASDLIIGDHIFWPMAGFSHHHAIVTAWKGGDKVIVVHVANTANGHEVCEQLIDLGHIIRQGKLYRYDDDPQQVCEPYDVIVRARSMLGRKYDILGNNSERFVLWCKCTTE